MRLVTFHVSAIECALPIERLREIVEPPPITRVPGASAALRGVTNLRGQVIPVLDVAVRLGLAPSEAGRVCLLIAEAAAAEGACALLVDGVRDIEEIAEGQLLPPRRDVLGAGEWLAGFFEREGRLVLVLDAERLLDPETVRGIRLTGPRAPRVDPLARAAVAPPHPFETPPGPPQASMPGAAGEASPTSAAARAEATWARVPRDAAAPVEARPAEAPRALRLVVPLRSRASAVPAPAAAPRPRAPSPARARPHVVPAAPAPQAPPATRFPLSELAVAVIAVALAIAIAAIAVTTRRDAREGRRRPTERAAARVDTRPPQPARLEPAPPPALRAAVAGFAPGEPPPAASPLSPPASAPAARLTGATIEPRPRPPPALPSTPPPAAGDRIEPRAGGPPAPPARPPAPQPPPLRPGDVYQVVDGDTLWSISRRMLGDPYAWPDIHAANRPAVRDPDVIRPGQRLTVPARPAPAR